MITLCRDCPGKGTLMCCRTRELLPSEDRTQSYADAFYEIADMLNIPA